MQISIAGVPAIAVNKVMKDLSVSVHYLNEYIKKMWALGPAVPQGPIDCVDAGHDQVTECQSNLGNDTGNSNTLAFDSGGESDTELPR